MKGSHIVLLLEGYISVICPYLAHAITNVVKLFDLLFSCAIWYVILCVVLLIIGEWYMILYVLVYAIYQLLVCDMFINSGLLSVRDI